MFARTLLPTDLSRDSIGLAERVGALKLVGVEELVLLNVVETGPQIGFATDAFERIVAWKSEAEAVLAETSRRVAAAGVRCRWRLELGDPAAEIRRVAEEERVGLTVVASHRHSVFRYLFRRSLTLKVLKRATGPVLVVPVDAGDERAPGLSRGLPMRLILATDCSDGARGALAVAKQLPAAALRDVVVLHVGGRQSRGSSDADRVRQCGELVRGELQFFGLKGVCRVVQGDPTKLIVGAAAEAVGSWIVVGRTGGGRETDGHLGRVATSVVRRSRSPVLVMPGE